MVSKKPAASRSPKDAIAMLKADHQRVRQLLEQYDRLAGSDSADDGQKSRIAERICQEIEVHARLEEELFYPALRERIGGHDLLDEAEVEHQSARDLIRQIESMSPGDALYDAKVKVLGEYVDHHVQEEETQMMPKARRAKVDLVALGSRIAERREALEVENRMEPFEALSALLTMPIRAAASAARAGAAAARRVAGGARGAKASPSRGATGARKTGAARGGSKAGARKAGATTARAGSKGAAGATRTTRGATLAAGAAGRAAAAGAKRTAAGRPAAAGTRKAASSGPTAAGTRKAASGRPTAAGTRKASSSGPTAAGTRKAASGRPTAAGTRKAASGRPTAAGTRKAASSGLVTAGTRKPASTRPAVARADKAAPGRATAGGQGRARAAGASTSPRAGAGEGARSRKAVAGARRSRGLR